ncbi:hypothetical protein FF011L_50160 [Roseimaritima multifibrata]|uniref:Uncharacterized protein n=1 Tax=Roseimaritima multifibrata TaxID=1930274 RepID=A0A517MMV1_9BACT|nr:hypothetical protein [Roseimaritima multifibrata]QDS96208.1 hypothetical protein FF011L_50160 [Roseimaritima multifibrata]
MPRFAPTLLIPALIAAAFSCQSTASAQIVQIGPAGGVGIRAPFVSVDVGRFGGTRVRAPFTAVDTAGYPYGPRRLRRSAVVAPGVTVVRPPIISVRGQTIVDIAPSPRQPPEDYRPQPQADGEETYSLTEDQLFLELEIATSALQNALQAEPEGEGWIQYLQPAQIADLAIAGKTASLEALLRNYLGTERNRDFAWVANAPGFSATRDLIEEIILRQTQAGNVTVARPRSAPPAQTAPTPVQPTREAIEKSKDMKPELESLPAPQPNASQPQYDA